jgi:hypothetical protein
MTKSNTKSNASVTIPKLASKWLRREKRLAIYLRDNCECVFCGRKCQIVASVAGGNHDTLATIDHLEPRARFARKALREGRSLNDGLLLANRDANLATVCKRCNSLKKDVSKAAWTRLAATIGVEVNWRRIGRATKRSLKPYLAASKALLAGGNITSVDASALTATLEGLHS